MAQMYLSKLALEKAATFRIHDPTEVARRLARLASAREAFLAGADAIPIERHALLSDGRVMGACLSWCKN